MKSFNDRFLIDIVDAPVEMQRLIDFVTIPDCGAVVMFLGTVRELTAGRRTAALTYEAYPEMALPLMYALGVEACSRWPISRLGIIHRIGQLTLTETSVAVAVSAPHRKAAFDAAEFLIDELKSRVPIWKKEHWADGTTEWIHPGTETRSES